MRPITTAACLLTATGSAFAQSGVATYSIAFGSPTGPSSIVLAPGGSTEVFVNVAFAPGVGAGTPTINGLSDGTFSIDGSGSGAGTWSVDANLSSPTSSLPHPWGGQASQIPIPPGVLSVGTPSGLGVNGVRWGFGFLFTVHPYPQNPANVWRATFTAVASGAISTQFTAMGPTGLFARAVPVHLTYASQGLSGQITIIPGPACGLALALAGLIAPRRRSAAKPR